MKIITEKRAIIGECPIWNEKDGLLYYVCGAEKEICTYNPKNDEIFSYKQDIAVSSIAFTKDGRMIAAREDGVFFLDRKSGKTERLYDESTSLTRLNDAKVGPDGALYVGSIGERWLKISEKADGKLYRISPEGKVNTLAEGFILSNGLDWSIDEKFFYLVDTGDSSVRKYEFDSKSGEISATAIVATVNGADGLTVNQKGEVLVACWGYKKIEVLDGENLNKLREIQVPTRAPASCGFFGRNMNLLAITTASLNTNLDSDNNAGMLIIAEEQTPGRKPYLFG